MHEPYPLPYLHHNHRVDHRAVPRQLPPSPSPESLNKASSTQSQSNKKPGATKGKGAVRAKSGCYTCRIRRKKCDETQDASGSCQTCIRLRLECLGFGAKRPEWMRENNSVPELRDKIKQFLASQGMIKGHSGSGARNSSENGNNGPILILSAELPNSSLSRNNANSSNAGSCPSSPQSPPSATTTTSSSHHTYPHIVTSAMRDAPAPRNSDSVPYSPLSPDTDGYHSPAAYTPLPPINSQSSLHTHGLLHPVNEMSFMASYVPTHSQHTGESNGSSVSPSSQLHHHPMSPMTPIHSSHSYFTSPTSPTAKPMQRKGSIDQSQPAVLRRFSSSSSSSSSAAAAAAASAALELRPLQSTLSPLYTAKFEEADDDDLVLSSPNTYYIPSSVPILPDPNESYYITYYLKEVFARQYLLADKTVGGFLYHFATTNDAVKNSMCLLSSLHMHCMRQLNAAYQSHSPSDTDDIHRFYRRVKQALTESHEYAEGDAMAGLHVVSSFLFSGGRGPWPQYLDVAIRWVRAKLDRYSHPADALVNASYSEGFIIRTTMWFDVWASITQLCQPAFLDTYRALFGNGERDGAYIGDVSLDSVPNLNMVNVVGCTNTSFRAMAEIATLASWKDAQVRESTLSVPKLVERGLQIEEYWLPHDPSMGPDSPSSASDISFRRSIVAQVFRASARVYLHMVLSSSFPKAPEIKNGVGETIAYLRRIPTSDHVNTRAVVRSVMFAICVCGCLTEDVEQQQFFLTRLDDLGEEANVFGNCKAVKSLMQKVWKMREESGDDIDWREVMTSDASGPLLLV